MKTRVLHTGVLFWLPLLLLVVTYEIAAALGLVPWPTITGTIYAAISWWPPFRWLLGVFLMVLGFHLCFHLRAGALIFVSLVAVTAIVIHLAELYA